MERHNCQKSKTEYSLAELFTIAPEGVYSNNINLDNRRVVLKRGEESTIVLFVGVNEVEPSIRNSHTHKFTLTTEKFYCEYK